MEICFVVQSASRIGYGLFPAVSGAARALSKASYGIRVVAGADEHSARDAGEWAPVPVTALRLAPPRRLHYAPGLARWFAQQPQLDVISLHGVWMAMHATALRFARRRSIPVVLSPHGSLHPWALGISKARKRLGRLLYADRVLYGVDCLHALNEDEALFIRRFGLKAPIAVIPNGVDLPGEVAPRDYGGGLRTLLFMGRIHSIKGIRELVKAWTLMHDKCSDWELVVAGPDETGQRAELERESAACRVRFVGEVRGNEKAKLFRTAHAFILPSFSEALPTTVLEAWSYGLPVVMTHECNLREGFAVSAAIEVRPEAHSIAATLPEFLRSSPQQLAAMGERGRQLVVRDYSWERVAENWGAVYGWLSGRNDRPALVHLD